MKLDRIALFGTAFLLFLTALSSLALPEAYYFVLRILVPVVATYTLFAQPDASVGLRASLVLLAFVYNPFYPVDFPEPANRIIALASAAGFLRLGLRRNTAADAPRKQV